MSLIDQIAPLVGQRLVFTLAAQRPVIGELVSVTDDGFVVDGWYFDSFFGDDKDRRRVFLFAHSVVYVTQWRDPQCQLEGEKAKL